MGVPRGGLPKALASLPLREPGRLGTPKLGVSGPRLGNVFSDVTAVEGAADGAESRDSKARNALAVGFGAVLLRLRLWYLLMTGGNAASLIGSYWSCAGGLSYSDIVGMPSVVKDLNCGRALDPLAILIESRIGRLRREPPRVAAGLLSSGASGGIGGSGARSCMLIGECDKKDKAVSQM